MKPAKQIAYILLCVTAVAAAYATFDLFQQSESSWDKYVLILLALIAGLAVVFGVSKHALFANAVLAAGVTCLLVVVAQRIITEEFAGNQLFYGLSGIFLIAVGYLIVRQKTTTVGEGTTNTKKIQLKVKSHHHKHRKRGHK